MLKIHDYVCEIAREINLELRDVFLTLERLGYIERGEGEWIPTDTGWGNVLFKKNLLLDLRD